MNDINNDIPSPVEEGVVDNYKKFFNKNNHFNNSLKESYIPSLNKKEKVQEELFPILTGKELPVKEMSDNAAEALAVASAIGLVGLGMGLFSLVNKGIDKLFGNKKSSGSTKINRKSADTLKKLGKEFMDTQTIDSNERRNAYNDAIKLLKQYYPKEYVKKHFGISLIGGEWNEPSDFYKGKINICDFAFINSASQEIPGYEEIRKKNLPEDEEDEQREIAKNKYHKTIREMLNFINKDLAKKYKGKYRVYCEEFDDYWDIYGEGDGDEGVLIIADVDIISRMKSYVSNHAAKESFTLINNEAGPVEEVSFSTAGRAILGILSTLGIGYGIKKFIDHKKSKIEEKPAPGFNEDEFLNNNPVDTEKREAVYKGAIAIVKKIFGKHIQYVGSKNFDPNVFIGKAKPKINDIFVIDLCRILDFTENPEVVKVFNTLDDEKEKQAFVKKEFPKWDQEIRKLLKKAQDEIQKKFGTKYELEFGSVNDWCVLCMIDTAYVTKLASASRAARESTEVVSEAEPVEEGLKDFGEKALGMLAMSGLGAIAIGGVLLLDKGLDRLINGKEHSEKLKSEKIKKELLENVKKLAEEFMKNQKINSSERRKVLGDAYSLIENHFDKDLLRKGAIWKDNLWEDQSDFINGKINLVDFAFTDSYHQEIQTTKANWLDVLRKCKKEVNNELKKKYHNKYRIFFEELDDEFWDYYGQGDGDEGGVIIVDVEMSNKVLSYIKSKYQHIKNSEDEEDDNIDTKIHHKMYESTEVATESTVTNIAKVLGWFAVLVGAAAYKRRKDNKEAYEKAKKEQEAMVKERSKEISEYAKQTDYVAKHPVDTKERKAVLNYAYKAIEKAVDKYYISMLDTNGNATSFTGENKDPLIPDVFCIDVCSLTPPEQFDDEYEHEEEWEKDVDPLVSDANKELQKKFGKKYSLVREDHMIFLIDTTYKAGLLNAVKENYAPFMDVYTAALEGWGIAFTRFAVKHNLPFANKLEDKVWEWSESTVNQLTNIPEFKEYVLREAPKAYEDAYLKNNNLSINVNADMIAEFEEEYEDTEAYNKVDKRNCCFCKKIGRFYVGIFGDKSHIHGVWLLMSDSKNKKIYAKALPAPDKEINKFKYQK